MGGGGRGRASNTTREGPAMEGECGAGVWPNMGSRSYFNFFARPHSPSAAYWGKHERRSPIGLAIQAPVRWGGYINLIQTQELAKADPGRARVAYNKEIILCSLDLLSGLAEGLGTSIESLVSRNDLRDLLLQCCANEAADVWQSALALLGDLAKTAAYKPPCTGRVQAKKQGRKEKNAQVMDQSSELIWACGSDEDECVAKGGQAGSGGLTGCKALGGRGPGGLAGWAWLAELGLGLGRRAHGRGRVYPKP
ncbi:unnamed protein product [Calypogeia fissa]